MMLTIYIYIHYLVDSLVGHVACGYGRPHGSDPGVHGSGGLMGPVGMVCPVGLVGSVGLVSSTI